MAVKTQEQELHDLLRREMQQAGETAFGLAASLGTMRLFNNPLCVGAGGGPLIELSPTTAFLAAGQMLGNLNSVRRNNLIEQALKKCRKKNNYQALIDLMNIRLAYWIAQMEMMRAHTSKLLDNVNAALQTLDDELLMSVDQIHEAICRRTPWYNNWRQRLQLAAGPEVTLPWFLRPEFLIGQIVRHDAAPVPALPLSAPEQSTQTDPPPQDDQADPATPPVAPEFEPVAEPESAPPADPAPACPAAEQDRPEYRG